jgi:hypothetical protein
MYVNTTVTHHALPEDLSDKVVGRDNQVALHLPLVYMSMTPDEATRLATALLHTAAEVRMKQAVKMLAEAETEQALAVEDEARDV